MPLLALEMLGLQVEPVFGIDCRLMFERGEANIDYQTSSSYLSGVAPLVEAGTAVPWFSFGALDEDGNIVRDPTFPDMPSFKEVCEAKDGCETRGEAWDVWEAFVVADFPALKIVFLPAGASDAAIATYTQAFEDVKARADFAEISRNQLGVYPQLNGAGAQTALESATGVHKRPKTSHQLAERTLRRRTSVSWQSALRLKMAGGFPLFSPILSHGWARWMSL